MRKMTILALSLVACAAFAPPRAQAQVTPPPLPPPMLLPSAQYYFNDNGRQAGPFTLDQIRQRIASGAITPDTLVWKSGTPNWVAAREFPELASGGGAGGGGARPAVASGACSGQIEISDDFSETEADQTQAFESGKLKFKAMEGKFDFFTYKKALSGDADICVIVQIPHKFNNASNTFGGVIFGGASDGGDFNAFLVSPTGNGSMLRLKGKNLDLPVEWHRANGLDPSPGAKNRVRISVKGGTATFYVNDTQFATFNGPLPNGAGKLGVIVKSEPGKRDAWKFINFKATDL
jgi:GYF domain 2